MVKNVFFTKYGATTLIKMFTSSFYQKGCQLFSWDIRYPNYLMLDRHLFFSHSDQRKNITLLIIYENTYYVLLMIGLNLKLFIECINADKMSF